MLPNIYRGLARSRRSDHWEPEERAAGEVSWTFFHLPKRRLRRLRSVGEGRAAVRRLARADALAHHGVVRADPTLARTRVRALLARAAASGVTPGPSVDP